MVETNRNWALSIFGLLLFALYPAPAAAQIDIYPGTNIQSVVNAHPAGSTFRLMAGLHRMQSVSPRNGDTFIGESGTVLSGARSLTSFTRTGSGTQTATSYLSDRSWTFETNGWGPVERDRSNSETSASDGRAIVLGGQRFGKGLGVHAPSDVRLSLGGQCSSFSASVGVDDEVGGLGSVVFQVWADGIQLYDSGVLDGNNGPQAVNVDVSGRHDLQLIVSDAGNNNYYDHADWADARVTCNEAGGYWIASGQTQQGIQSHGADHCQAENPRCASPEQLFIDDKALWQVGSIGELRSGTFYFDYNNDQIYFADNPDGRRVEASVTPSAFESGANNVTVSGLTVEKYANIAQQGAIHAARGTGWRVTNNQVRWTHGTGIRIGTQAQVLGNNVHHNGQLGIGGSGDDALVADNEIAYNNTSRFEVPWEGAATKFMGTRNLVVRGNWVHHNHGVGLWTDNDNINTLYEGNTSDDNEWMGILHEISYSAVIRNNVVRRNGWAFSAYIWGAGILITASPDVEIVGNYLEGNADGIGAAQQSREHNVGAYGPHEIWNLWVHDNIIMNPDGWSGLVQDIDSSNSYFTSRNNRFERNVYQPGHSLRFLQWMNGERTFLEWIGFGQDVLGGLR
ncbi:MAG: hypothetical protein GEU82_02885 [Luteitalea sp.]|nr:hypothetical protein [Luteitalea sp.]